MTLSQFISQHKGKFLEVVDPTNKNQCMDLSRAWFDNLGYGQANAHMFAYEVYTKATTETLKHFDKIPNTIDAVPQEGDIVVWAKEYNGTAGHIAIATGEGDTLSFQAFSQNDPIGSPCILKTYTYVYVIGWLRPKNYKPAQNPDTTWPNKDKYDALIRSFSAFNDQGRTNYYTDDPSRLTADIIDREETIEDLRLELRDKEQEYTQKQKELQIQLDQIQKDLDKERNAVIEAQEDLKTTKDKLSTIQGTLIECEHKIEDMATNSEKDEEILTLRGDIVQLQAENEMIRRVSLYGLIDWVKSLKLK